MKSSISEIVIQMAMYVMTLQPLLLHTKANSCLEVQDGDVKTLQCGQLSGPLNNINGKNLDALIVDGDKTHWTEITRANLSSVLNIQTLRIMNTKIKHIRSDSFERLRQLKHLDLSSNSLLFFETNTFRGLKLDKLILKKNRGLRLKRDTFAGSSIGKIVLDECGIDMVDFRTFDIANIHHISLIGNKISEISKDFASLIKPKTLNDAWGSLNLAENPLQCTCDIYWLVQIILDEERSMDNRRNDKDYVSMRNMGFKCASPSKFKGRHLPMDRESLCPLPKITDIFVEMIDPDYSSARLTCRAKGEELPSLSWIKTGSDRIVRFSSESQNHFKLSDGLQENEFSLNVSLKSNRMNEFTCVAFNAPHSNGYKLQDLQRSHLVDVKFFTPMLIKNSTEVKSDPTKDVESFSNKVYQDKYGYGSIFSKRYTLLELIGAIFGTFFMTIVMLYCLSRFMHIFCQAKRKKIVGETMNKNYLKGSEVKCTIENNSDVFFSQNDSMITSPTNGVSAPSGTVSSSLVNNTPNWPQPEYYYSNSTGNEYDIPRNWDHPNNSPSLQSQCPALFQTTGDNRGSLSTTLLRKGLPNAVGTGMYLSGTTDTSGQMLMLPNQLTTNPNFTSNGSSSTVNSPAYFPSINPSVLPISYLTGGGGAQQQPQLKNLTPNNQLLLQQQQQQAVANFLLSQQKTNPASDMSMNTMQGRVLPGQPRPPKGTNFGEDGGAFNLTANGMKADKQSNGSS